MTLSSAVIKAVGSSCQTVFYAFIPCFNTHLFTLVICLAYMSCKILLQALVMLLLYVKLVFTYFSVNVFLLFSVYISVLPFYIALVAVRVVLSIGGGACRFNFFP